MKKIAIVPMVLGVAMGAVAIKLGLDFVKEAQASGGKMVPVVVSTIDIGATSEIDQTMVKTIQTPTSPLLGGDSHAAVKDVVGRVALTSIPPGAVVREALLAPKGTPPGLTVRIPAGYRAVSVKINEVSGVGYQVQPGAYVDVIAVIDVRDPETRHKETFSRIILQQVKVIAVGRMLSADDQASGKSNVAKSVTLLVKNSDVPKLHLAETRGTVTLAMRGPDDDLTSDEGYASESELFGLGKHDPEETDEESEPEPTPKLTNVVPLPVARPHAVTVVNGQSAPMIMTFESATSMQITDAVSLGGATANGMRPQASNMNVPALDFEDVMEYAAPGGAPATRTTPSPG